MTTARRKSPDAAVAGSSWTCTPAGPAEPGAAVDGSSWTREAQPQRGSSWTRTAAVLRGSSWTREAKQQRGSSWTSEAMAVPGSSWTHEAKPQRGSSWTRTALAGLAALAVGGAAAPALASNTPAPAATAQTSTFLVRSDSAHLSAVAARVRSLGGTVNRTLSAVGILEVSLSPDQLGALQHTAGVLGTTANRPVKMLTEAYDPTTDVNSLTSATTRVGLRTDAGYGPTGKGVDVAIVDSGVAPVAGLDGADKVIHGPDLSFESQNPHTRYLDTFGHGTHLAGIIAGHDSGVSAGTVGPKDPAFLGAAPDARILSVKVADAHGNSDVSQVIAGIDWVVQHAHDKRANLNVRVLNLSFGTDANVDYLKDPLSQAVEVAWRRGIVVVVSAGNRADDLHHLTDPAIDPFVISVAAGTPEGGVADFSSRGDGTRNPDVTAPGTHVPSLRVPGSFIDESFPKARVDDRFIRGSGTSQAAAFVSGMVADMVQADPSMSPDEAKFRLRNTATAVDTADQERAAGAGLVNAKALTDASLLPAATDAAAAAPSDSATVGIDVPAPSSSTPVTLSGTPATDSQMAQTFAPSSGTGSLDAARGSFHLVNGQKALTGEQDIFGSVWNGTTMARRTANGNAWHQGVFNGHNWTGSAWGGSAWGGSAWGGSAWGGSAWGGSAWGGSAWGTGAWNGSAWGGSAWGGSAWGGSAWGGSAWGGSAWGGSAWGGSAWGGSAWGGSAWGSVAWG